MNDLRDALSMVAFMVGCHGSHKSVLKEDVARDHLPPALDRPVSLL